jgi:hypothetical protein
MHRCHVCMPAKVRMLYCIDIVKLPISGFTHLFNACNLDSSSASIFTNTPKSMHCKRPPLERWLSCALQCHVFGDSRHFGETYRLHLQGRRVRQERKDNAQSASLAVAWLYSSPPNCCVEINTSIISIRPITDDSGRAVYGINCFRSFGRWGRGFESHSKHGCLCLRSFCDCVVLCASSILTTGWSLAQGVPPSV